MTATLTLSIIVPVYNESPRLEDVVRRLFSSPCPIDREWIFVDDCSSDGSRDILDRLAKEHHYQLIPQERT